MKNRLPFPIVLMPKVWCLLGIAALAVSCFGTSRAIAAESAPTSLMINWRTTAFGLNRPPMSFQWRANGTAKRIKAWQIQVASSMSDLIAMKHLLWDSGRQLALPDFLPSYQGSVLAPFTRYYWRVRLWNQSRQPSPWSSVATFATGPLSKADWHGQWISYRHKLLLPFYGTSSDPSMTQANWIAPVRAVSVPGTAVFYRKFVMPIHPIVKHAILTLAASAGARVAINGILLTRSMPYLSNGLYRINIMPVVHKGTNFLAIHDRSASAETAIVAQIVLSFQKSHTPTQTISTDHRWRVASPAPDTWVTAIPPTDSSQPQVLGRFGIKPWGYLKLVRRWPQKYPDPMFRKTFNASEKIVHAWLYVSGLGYYLVKINGHSVGHRFLDPPYTDYDRRVLYGAYDVTNLIRSGGANAIAVVLGTGWYHRMASDKWHFHDGPWGSWPRLKLMLRMVTASGSVHIIDSNSTWQATDSAILADGIRNGEVFDQSQIKPGFSKPEPLPFRLGRAVVVPSPLGKLRPELERPIRLDRVFRPVWIHTLSNGDLIAKFPKNMTGYCRLIARGRAGKPVVLRYAERCYPSGYADQNPMAYFIDWRHFQTTEFIPAHNGIFRYHPHFQYNGFQYVQISGLSSVHDLISLKAIFFHTVMSRIGEFRCSSTLLNSISKATEQSYKCNFMGYPTDCPTRERSGWTGDAELACTQALLTWANESGYEQWLATFRDEQQPDGELYNFMPTNGAGNYNMPDWDSASIVIPWNCYLYNADGNLLKQNFTMMRRYFNFITRHAKGWIQTTGYGDWAFWNTGRNWPITSTAIYYVDARIMRRVATILGHPRLAAAYTSDAKHIYRAFNRKFYRGHGIYDAGTETTQATALYDGLVPPNRIAKTVAQLIKIVNANHDHPNVGVLGSRVIFRELTRSGHANLAVTMALKTTPPSYGWWMKQGATTLWETWNGLSPPGSPLFPYRQSSRNHIMFGDINGWFYNDLAGIRPDPRNPGFEKVIIAPALTNKLAWVSAWHKSLYGKIVSSWRWMGKMRAGKHPHRDDQTLHYSGTWRLKVKIPAGSTALIILPAAHGKVDVAGHALRGPMPTWTAPLNPQSSSQVTVSGGTYCFTLRPRKKSEELSQFMKGNILRGLAF